MQRPNVARRSLLLPTLRPSDIESMSISSIGVALFPAAYLPGNNNANSRQQILVKAWGVRARCWRCDVPSSSRLPSRRDYQTRFWDRFDIRSHRYRFNFPTVWFFIFWIMAGRELAWTSIDCRRFLIIEPGGFPTNGIARSLTNKWMPQ